MAVGLIDGMDRLTGFSYKLLYGLCTGTIESDRVTIRSGSTVD